MEKQANLSSKGIAAVFWGGFGSAMRAALQIGTQIILARLLGPAEYGVFAVAAIVISFSRFFSDIGISYGLIQKKTVTADDIRFVFTWQVILGSTVGGAVFLLAGPLSGFFKEPRLLDVLRAASAICLISALGSPSINLLKRDLDFKSVQASQVYSYIFGYVVVGIPMALAGMQVWALIGAFVGNELMSLILLYRRARHPLGFKLRHGEDGGLLVYGARVFITNIQNWIISNIDRVIIGRMFPGAQIGLYSVSYNLVSNPALTIINVIQSALFSTSARVQDDVDRLRRAFLTVIGAITLLLFPVFAGIAAVSGTILHSLYGSSWLGATELLRPVALAMPVTMLVGMATPLLWISGHPQKEFNIQVPIALGFVVVAGFAALYSMEAVAWSVFVMYLVRAFALVGATCRVLGIRARDMLDAMSGGIAVTALTAACIFLADLSVRKISGMPLAWLAVDVAAGAIGLAGSLCLFPALVNPLVGQLFEKIAARLPAATGGWVRKLIYRGQLRRSA